MSEYINRLIKCGYSPTKAYITCQNFIKEFSLSELVKFIVALEEDVCGWSITQTLSGEE